MKYEMENRAKKVNVFNEEGKAMSPDHNNETQETLQSCASPGSHSKKSAFFEAKKTFKLNLADQNENSKSMNTFNSKKITKEEFAQSSILSPKHKGCPSEKKFNYLSSLVSKTREEADKKRVIFENEHENSDDSLYLNQGDEMNLALEAPKKTIRKKSKQEKHVKDNAL